MRRTMRIVGTLLAVAGALTLVWAFVVWQWMDPFTGLYTRWKQHQLAAEYHKREAAFRAPVPTGPSLAAERQAIAREAKRYRRDVGEGDAIGRIQIPRIGLNMVLVDGTDHESLKKGPGRYLGSFMPGEDRLVYIAGHRTTYLAPFRRVDDLRADDRIVLTMPYGRFTYRVQRTQVVDPQALWVTRDAGYQRLVLSACHPLYSAAERIVVFARLERVLARGAAVRR
jgi:sortase A